ncbi:hypothetical protein NG2371_06225 [Nocardia gamkensis]|nr:hypothetical protein [Nocardia gamkensis]
MRGSARRDGYGLDIGVESKSRPSSGYRDFTEQSAYRMRHP